MQINDRIPFFSIITPVFNRKECIKNAINCIKKQDFSDWEYIIVDDGSSDGTAEVIDKAAEDDSRIISLHLPHNQGVSSARNLGIQSARGKYLLFLDSDDEYKDGAFSFIHEIINTHSDTDAIIFSVDRFDESTKNTIIDENGFKTLEYKDIRYTLLAGLLGTCEHKNDNVYRHVVWNKCVKKSIFDNNNILFDVNKVTWEDLEVCIKIIANCKKIITTDTAIVMDRTSDVDEHLSMRYYPSGAKNVLSEYKWMVEEFGKEFDFNSEFAYNWIFQNIQIWLLRTMSKDKNRRALMAEILTDPVFIKIVTSRNANGFFEKEISKALSKKHFRTAYRLYWLQNLINRGECF